MENNTLNHWETVYQNSPTEKLCWFEQESKPSLDLIEECQLDKSAAILNVGGGSSTLVDSLVDLGYRHIITNDLSAEALQILQTRLGDRAGAVTFVQDDLTNPKQLIRPNQKG